MGLVENGQRFANEMFLSGEIHTAVAGVDASF